SPRVLGSWFDDVRDGAVLFVDDVDDAERTERAGIEGLTAGGGIKRRAIEGDERAALARLDAPDRRVKFAEIRIGVIQAVGHLVSQATRQRASAAPPARSRAARKKTSRRPTRSRSARSIRRTTR